MRDGTATRLRLERCALTLFVEKGITATTIKDIALKADIAEGTLYRHYKSKEELAEKLYLRSYEIIYDRVKKLQSEHSSFLSKMKVMITYFCENYDEDPILFNYLLLTQHHQLKILTENKIGMHELLVSIVNDAIQHKEIPKQDPNFYSAIVLGILLQAAVSRVYKRISRNMKDDKEILFNAVMGALKA